VIDVHAHVGESQLVAKTTDLATGVFGPDAALEYMDKSGVDMACFFPTSNPISDYSKASMALCEASRENPDRVIAFGRINPNYGVEHNKALIRDLSQAGARGLKFHPLLDGAYPINDRKLVRPLMETIAECELAVISHCGEVWTATPALLADLAMDFPTIPFIAGHMGLYGFHHEAFAFGRRLDNLYLDTTEFYPAWWISEAARIVGPEKILWGSDIPYLPYGQEQDKITKWAGLEPAQMRLIFGQNLARILNLSIAGLEPQTSADAAVSG
jgi:predicted TIM-barrel fold metal-dependent hydrolase